MKGCPFPERMLKGSLSADVVEQNIAGGLDAVVSAPDLAPAACGAEHPLGLQLRAPLALQHALNRHGVSHGVDVQPVHDHCGESCPALKQGLPSMSHSGASCGMLSVVFRSLGHCRQ